MKSKKYVWAAANDDVTLVNSKKLFSGRISPGAQLDVYTAIPGIRVQTLQADANGRYQTQLPPGLYIVHVSETASVQLDAALARPEDPSLLDESILGIGAVYGFIAADVGLNVRKSGRSTGLTRGQVTVIGATVTINFTYGRSARFTNQIVTTKMGSSGDSGALLLDLENKAVGLLFAGGAAATIYHPISDVLETFNIRLTRQRSLWQGMSFSLGRYRHLDEVSRGNSQEILKLPNVVGVGIGHKNHRGFNTGEPCITVLVSKKVPLSELQEQQIIPKDLDGVLTDVIETGLLTADTETQTLLNRHNHTHKLRPARPGISIGHYLVTAGTLGAVVYDNDTNEALILSNNHVIANATNGIDGLAEIGDPILQPGKADGGLDETDVIARLIRFHPLQFQK